MATVEQLAQALAEARQHLGESQRLATEAQRAGVQMTTTSTGQVDPRDEQVPNLLRSRHRVERMVPHLRVCGSRGESRSSDGRCIHWIGRDPFVELPPEMKFSAKQLYYLLVNTVRGKALILFRSAEKHHGIAAWKRIKTSPTQLDGIQQCSWESCNLLVGTLEVRQTRFWTN